MSRESGRHRLRRPNKQIGGQIKAVAKYNQPQGEKNEMVNMIS